MALTQPLDACNDMPSKVTSVKSQSSCKSDMRRIFAAVRGLDGQHIC
jgi:hypothetical protein